MLKLHNTELPRTCGIYSSVAFQDVETLNLLSDLYNAKVLSRFVKLFPTDLIVGIVNRWKIMKANSLSLIFGFSFRSYCLNSCSDSFF